MALQPLTWSEPRAAGYGSISAEDGAHGWYVTPVPRDVVRISYNGVDPDGTVVNAMEHQAYAESLDEAMIVIEVLRAGTDHLPDWRDQLEAAGFVRTYPEASDDETLSMLWHDRRPSGLFQITIRDGSLGTGDVSVHATYESGRANFWHNVSRVEAGTGKVRSYGDVTVRDGLPHGVDALKAGVAAALAIRAARTARGGRFAQPLGGPIRQR